MVKFRVARETLDSDKDNCCCHLDETLGKVLPYFLRLNNKASLISLKIDKHLIACLYLNRIHIIFTYHSCIFIKKKWRKVIDSILPL